MEMNQIKFIYLFLILFGLNLNLFNCLFINQTIHWRSIDDYEKPDIDDYRFMVVVIYYNLNDKDSGSILGYGTIVSSEIILVSKGVLKPWNDPNQQEDPWKFEDLSFLKNIRITPITNIDTLNFNSNGKFEIDNNLSKQVLKFFADPSKQFGSNEGSKEELITYDALLLETKHLKYLVQRKEHPIVINPAVFVTDYNFYELEQIFVVTFDCAERHQENPKIISKFGMPKSGIETLTAIKLEKPKVISKHFDRIATGESFETAFCIRDKGSPIMAIKNKRRFQIGHIQSFDPSFGEYACKNDTNFVAFTLFKPTLQWMKEKVNEIKLTKLDSFPKIKNKSTILTPTTPPSEYTTSTNDTSKLVDHPPTNKFAISIWVMIFIGFLIIAIPIGFIWKLKFQVDEIPKGPKDQIIPKDQMMSKEPKKESKAERKEEPKAERKEEPKEEPKEESKDQIIAKELKKEKRKEPKKKEKSRGSRKNHMTYRGPFNTTTLPVSHRNDKNASAYDKEKKEKDY